MPKMLVILVTLITIGGCLLSWNNIYTLSCDLEQEIQSQYLLHPKIPNVKIISYGSHFELFILENELSTIPAQYKKLFKKD
jgi:cell division protein FtsX